VAAGHSRAKLNRWRTMAFWRGHCRQCKVTMSPFLAVTTASHQPSSGSASWPMTKSPTSMWSQSVGRRAGAPDLSDSEVAAELLI